MDSVIAALEVSQVKSAGELETVSNRMALLKQRSFFSSRVHKAAILLMITALPIQPYHFPPSQSAQQFSYILLNRDLTLDLLRGYYMYVVKVPHYVTKLQRSKTKVRIRTGSKSDRQCSLKFEISVMESIGVGLVLPFEYLQLDIQ